MKNAGRISKFLEVMSLEEKIFSEEQENRIRAIVKEEVDKFKVSYLKGIYPPELWQELQKQLPYLKFGLPEKSDTEKIPKATEEKIIPPKLAAKLLQELSSSTPAPE